MSKFICGKEKYALGGPREDTIGLPVSFLNLPATIEVEGLTLYLKTSLHISLVCIGKIIEKHNIIIPDFFNKVVTDFCEFTKMKSIDLVRCRDEFKLVSENERRSLIVMCDVSNLNKFFDLVNEKYNLQLEYPPTHVTLYTLQKGIFLIDARAIEQLTKTIKNPGLVL